MNIWHLIKVITAYRPTKIAKYIKQNTKQNHDVIEQHPFFKDLLSGRLSDAAYANYLGQLLPLYISIENNLCKKNWPIDLITSIRIADDIKKYREIVDIDTKVWPVAMEWINHFYSKPVLLQKTDLYIRWLADLYGGQILKNRVKFNSKYSFKNARRCIQIVRKYIEEGINDSNKEMFVYEVNKSYDLHYKLVDQIYEKYK